MATALKGVEVSDERMEEIHTIAKEYALSHGLGIKAGFDLPESSKVISAPFSLFPSVIPARILLKAKSTMCQFNRMMHKVALNHEFLQESLKNVITVDDFMRNLWNIYLQVREKGIKQPAMLGLNRNDFMVNCLDQSKAKEGTDPDCMRLKQIEFNTIAASFAGLSQRVTNLERLTLRMTGKTFTNDQLPINKPANGLARGLIKAWEYYNNNKAVIVFMVGQREKNSLDQRALEFFVYEENPTTRIIFKTLLDFEERGVLDDETGKLTIDGDEVAVLYLRDGYTAENYPTQQHWDGRLKMELSRAIKCPSIQHQLAGAKKIQQELARPGVLEKFVDDPEVVVELKDTFADLYSLDLGEEGDAAVKLALASPHKYVLKPQREGGGHNMYGDDITKFLKEHATSEERNAYILMERIFPLQQKNYLCKEGVPFRLSTVVNELGIYGVYLGTTELKEIANEEVGHMMRTKLAETDEGGVVAGFAVLDMPFIY